MSIVKENVIQVVNAVPYGRVSSYGMVAEFVGWLLWKAISAQLVGRILSWLKQEEFASCSWQRIVNKQGFISSLKLWDRWWRQKELLESEWVLIVDFYVDMERYALSREDFRLYQQAVI